MVMGRHKVQRLLPAGERYAIVSVTGCRGISWQRTLCLRDKGPGVYTGFQLAPPGLSHVGYGSGAVANVASAAVFP